VTGSGAKKPPAAPRKKKKRAGPVSLHPLSFDDAMRALLGVPSVKRQKDDLACGGDGEEHKPDTEEATQHTTKPPQAALAAKRKGGSS